MKTERYILKDFKVDFTFSEVLKKAGTSEPDDIELLKTYFDEAKQMARPKAIYKVCYVDEITPDGAVIDGIAFASRRMVKNLKDIHRVFAYVMTCGMELEPWAKSDSDFVLSFWKDEIKELVLRAAMPQFYAHIKSKYRIEKISSMNPGSGNADVWPIAQQTQLFQLIGGVTEDIGVELADSMLMEPNKSVSGIMFPSDSGYVNCAVCQRESCQNRRAPYDASL